MQQWGQSSSQYYHAWKGAVIMPAPMAAVLGALIAIAGTHLYSQIKMQILIKQADPLLQKFKEEIKKYDVTLGDDDSAWIKEGIRLKVLDPELVCPMY